MSLKSYFWGLRISALATFAAWILVVCFIDPTKAGVSGLVLFYTSSFLFAAGMAILFFTWLRQKTMGGQEIAFVYLGVSFRQGLLIALLLILLLLMQQYRVATWWDSALVVVGILLTELYFLTKNNC